MQIVFDPYAIHPDDAFIMQLDNITSQKRFFGSQLLMILDFFPKKVLESWRIYQIMY